MKYRFAGTGKVIRTMLPGLAIWSAGCAHTRATLAPPAPITITLARAPCPAPTERARLRTARPVPLAHTPMPATARERVDKAVAQMGRYEAGGGWADQVDAALDRCQLP